MSDPKFREIQLGGKQLVFLFMAVVVGAVAIFLLGISVGRGVRSATTDTSPTTDVAVVRPPAAPAEMPPPTETTPADLKYHDQLQGQTPPVPSTFAAAAPGKPATPPADPPSAAADAPPALTPASSPSATRTATPPVQPPSATKATDKTAAKPDPARTSTLTKADPAKAETPAPSGNGWFVQVNAFRSKENADRQAADLKAKGFTAAAVS